MIHKQHAKGHGKKAIDMQRSKTESTTLKKLIYINKKLAAKRSN